MSRVLHIIDSRTPLDALLQLSLLARPDEPIFSAGPPPWAGGAEIPARKLHCPLGLPELAGLRAAGEAPSADVVHAWSVPAARLAAVLARKRRCCALVSVPAAGDEVRRGLGRARRVYGLGVTVPTESARRALVAAGWGSSAVHRLPPPAAAIPDRDRLRLATRRALGAGEAETVLLAPAEMTLHAGLTMACWATATLRHAEMSVRLLLPGDGPGRKHADFFARSTGFASAIHLTGHRFGLPECLAAADVAVFFPRRDGGVAALAAAMRARLPIAAFGWPDVAECAPPDEAACLAVEPVPREAARAVYRLLTRPELARRLARAAEARAVERFAPPECRRSLDDIYARLTARGPGAGR